jgi:ADP-heptose:LPS heptosyltransferase
MFHLGVAPGPIPAARLYSDPPAGRAPYAVFHAVASEAGKMWPAVGFVEVARWVRSSLGLAPVFVGSASDDLSAFAEFERFAGRPLKELIGLLRGAALFVGNDSGPAHMAAAAGAPVVVIFGNSDAQVWAPWQARAQTLVAGEAIGRLPAADVIAAVERLQVSA